VYSGALVLGIASVCLMALVYLFKAVFTPATLPATFAQWQGRLDPAALRQEHIPGVTTEAGRAPMVHYHKVDRWFGADPRNTCTVPGCHSPLPHSPEAPVAAFPNLHVTFLDCAVCHEPIDGEPLEVRWVASASGRPQAAPAVLRLARLLEGLNGGEAEAVKSHAAIVGLLKEMDGVTGRDPEVEDLLIQIESSVPHSPFWRKSVQELRRVLPLHARGEYGAKMARDYTATEPAVTARLTREYFAAGEGSARRREIGKQIHAKIVAKPGACSACHAAEGGRLNFLAAGYSPERARALRTLPLARMVEQIRAGESFQLPRVMEAGDER
jgi:mono/diheme cytochrome c family protein